MSGRLSCLAALLLALALPSAAEGRAAREAWRLVTRADGLPGDDVLSLCVAGDTLWVGTDGGLARRDGDRWTAWTAADGLPFPAISAIDVDPQTRDVWLGTWGGGLVRFSAGRFDRFDEINSGLAGNLVFAVRVQGSKVWAATNGGLSAFDWAAGTWELRAERRRGGPETAVTSLAVAGERLHAAAYCEGVLRIGEDDDDPDETIAAVPGGTGLGLATSGDALFVATPSRLLRSMPDGGWSERAIPRDPGESSWALAVSASGVAWLASGTTLLELPRFDRDKWIRHDVARSAGAVGRVRCLATMGEHVLAGTDRGLLERGAPAARAPVAPALPGAHVIGLLGPFGRVVSLPRGEGDAPAQRADEGAVLAAAEAVASRRALTVRKEPPGFVRYAWGLPEDEMIDTVRRNAPRALIGCIGPEERIASAVTVVTALPFLNVSTSPPSDDETASPWIFRCPSDDPRAQATFIGRALDAVRCRRAVLVRAADALDELRLGWWSEEARARGVTLVAEIPPPANDEDLTRLRALEFDAIFTWGDAGRTGELVRRLREAGFRQPVVAGDRAVSQAFLDAAGAEPGVVLAPWPCEHVLDAAGREHFIAAQRAAPAPIAWTSYDATRHVAEALEHAGPGAEALRRELQRMSRMRLARVVKGRWREEGPRPAGGGGSP